MIDLNRFKPITGTHGHPAGDAMLNAVAAAINATVRTGDLAVRAGGNEFTVVLENTRPIPRCVWPIANEQPRGLASTFRSEVSPFLPTRWLRSMADALALLA
jgi:GGDEF domain-containing protein